MVGDVLGPDGLSKNWIVNFIPDHIAGASYYAMFFIGPTIDGKIQTETLPKSGELGVGHVVEPFRNRIGRKMSGSIESHFRAAMAPSRRA
jgi:hypothetical protein